MRRFVCLVFGGAAALGAAACRPATPSATAPAPSRVRHEFAQACDPRPGIVRADLARAQRAARALLEECSVGNAPASLATEVAAVASYARGIADARDLRTAAIQTGHLARACGTCHQSTGTARSVAVVTTPEAGEGPLSAQMHRHYWASDRMWEGLIGPSDGNWAAGAAALREPTSYAAAAAGRSAAPQEVTRIAADLRDLGARAGAAAASEREHLYGEFLAGCAGCHTAVGGIAF